MGVSFARKTCLAEKSLEETRWKSLPFPHLFWGDWPFLDSRFPFIQLRKLQESSDLLITKKNIPFGGDMLVPRKFFLWSFLRKDSYPNGFQWTDWTLKNSKIETSHHFQDVTVTPVDLTKEGPIQNSRAVPTQTGATVVPIHVWKFGQLDRAFFSRVVWP